MSGVCGYHQSPPVPHLGGVVELHLAAKEEVFGDASQAPPGALSSKRKEGF